VPGWIEGVTSADTPAQANPAGIPDYAKDKPLPVPQIAKNKLANGIEVWVLPRTGVPRVDMVLAVRDADLAPMIPPTRVRQPARRPADRIQALRRLQLPAAQPDAGRGGWHAGE
jgi:hypothetical protein